MKKLLWWTALLFATMLAVFAGQTEDGFVWEEIGKKELVFLSQQFKEVDPNDYYIAITSYCGKRGKDLVVKIPQEIEGCKVIKVSWDKDVKKVVVPEAVIWFELSDDNESQVEFLRSKDKPFAWACRVNMRYFEELPTDRKIMFVYSGEYSHEIRLPTGSFTWPKNWTTMYGSSGGFYSDTNGWKKPLTKTGNFNVPLMVVYANPPFDEFSFEEGFVEPPISVGAKKIIFPKSMKLVRRSWSYRFDGFNQERDTALGIIEGVVIPEGSNIKFEPESISCNSIGAKKAMKALGYNPDF